MWINAERESWCLFLLFNVRAKRPEAFICDLGQRDTIDSIDPLDLVLQFSRNSNRQAGIFLYVDQLLEVHLSHTNIYGNQGRRGPDILQGSERICQESRGGPATDKKANRPQLTILSAFATIGVNRSMSPKVGGETCVNFRLSAKAPSLS